jgi:hypothetical protein
LIIKDIRIIFLKRLVIRYAIAPGAISDAITKIIPTAFSALTIVIDNSARRQ